MKTLGILITASCFLLVLCSIPFLRSHIYKRVMNFGYIELNKKLKESAWCTLSISSEIGVKNPPLSMESTFGFLNTFRGIMLLLRISILFIILFIIYPFALYILISSTPEPNNTVIQQVVLPLFANMMLVAMSISTLYSTFFMLALRKRIMGQNEE